MKSQRWLGIASVALLSASAFSQIAPAGGAYSFKMKLTKGQKISYVSTTSISAGCMKPIEMPLTMVCTDV